MSKLVLGEDLELVAHSHPLSKGGQPPLAIGPVGGHGVIRVELVTVSQVQARAQQDRLPPVARAGLGPQRPAIAQLGPHPEGAHVVGVIVAIAAQGRLAAHIHVGRRRHVPPQAKAAERRLFTRSDGGIPEDVAHLASQLPALREAVIRLQAEGPFLQLVLAVSVRASPGEHESIAHRPLELAAVLGGAGARVG